MKKLIIKKVRSFFFLKFEIFFVKIIPHMPYKVQRDRFAPIKKSIMANKLPLTNLE